MLIYKEISKEILDTFSNKSNWNENVDLIDYNINKGYIELQLKGKYSAFLQLNNQYEIEVRIPSFGGFKSIIHYHYVYELIRKLSK